MKKKPTGLGTKITLILLFFAGICMMCSFLMAFEETEIVEGIVEHTYMSGAANTLQTGGGSIAEVPMCRVVWYDKDGEEVIYGMPNDMDYEVGDSYFLEVDTETNRYPKRSVGEGVVGLIIGVIMCMVSILVWRAKFAKRKQKGKQKKGLSAMEQRRREAYDLQSHIPVIRCSICNGEQVAGFKEKKTGQFKEVMLIRNEKDLKEFKERYGVEEVVKEY